MQGVARLRGLQEDLKLSDTQYSTCLSILYVTYILGQVPSNIILNRVQRPSIYIGIVMLLWGAISCCSGATTNFGGMVGTRLALGLVESVFLPAALLILSKWYTRRELTMRNAFLFAGNLISNAFASLIGAGILSNMNGVMGHAAWRWMFWYVSLLVAESESMGSGALETKQHGVASQQGRETRHVKQKLTV